MEGLLAKRVDSPYEQKRSSSWVKVKCSKRQEFVIGGWSDLSGSRQRLGSLLVGSYQTRREFNYCGRVGTGFTNESLVDLGKRLGALATSKPPFVNPPTGHAATDVHWVQPNLVIDFRAWTRDGILRHAAFHGLREDKKPEEVSREVAEDPPEGRRKNVRAVAATVETGTGGAHANVSMQPTHPDRVLYLESKVTKRDLAEYYESIAVWILPHPVHRPLSIVRCPEGMQGACFFQRHMSQGMPNPIRGIEVREKDGMQLCFAINNAAGLVALAQIGALEIHP